MILYKILPVHVVKYNIMPFLNLKECIILYNVYEYDPFKYIIRERMKYPAHYKIYSTDCYRKSKYVIIYEMHADIITGFKVSNYAEGNEMRYIVWKMQDNDPNLKEYYAQPNGIRWCYEFRCDFPRYPTCIPLASECSLQDTLIISSLERLLDQGYVLYPYNDDISELLHWNNVASHIHIDEGIELSRYIGNEYYDISLDVDAHVMYQRKEFNYKPEYQDMISLYEKIDEILGVKIFPSLK